MTTTTFAPFKAIKVTCEVDWDLEDEDSPYREPKGYVPETVYTVELKADKMMEDRLLWEDEKTGEYVIDNDALADSNYLSDMITDDAGFRLKGYRVIEITHEKEAR